MLRLFKIIFFVCLRFDNKRIPIKFPEAMLGIADYGRYKSKYKFKSSVSNNYCLLVFSHRAKKK